MWPSPFNYFSCQRLLDLRLPLNERHYWPSLWPCSVNRWLVRSVKVLWYAIVVAYLGFLIFDRHNLSKTHENDVWPVALSRDLWPDVPGHPHAGSSLSSSSLFSPPANGDTTLHRTLQLPLPLILAYWPGRGINSDHNGRRRGLYLLREAGAAAPACDKEHSADHISGAGSWWYWHGRWSTVLLALQD